MIPRFRLHDLWHIGKSRVLYGLKMAEFRLKTWRNSFAISQAYNTPIPFKTILKPFVQPALKILIFTAAAGVLVLVVWQAKKMIPAGAPEAAIERADEEQKVPILKEEPARQQPPAPVQAVVPAPVPEVKVEAPPVSAPVAEVKKDPVPRLIGADGIAIPYYIIVANKGLKTLSLIGNDGSGWKVKFSFDMAFGEHPGPKVTAGDKRTPEGYYCITGRRERNELAPYYGPLAYMLNYPNAEDIKAGRTGQGIWIHGTDRDSAPGNSRGCLKLANKDILSLAAVLRNGIGTPVVIINDSLARDPAAPVNYTRARFDHDRVLELHRTSQQMFATLLSDWKTAWESRDIDKYQQFYALSSFQGDGQLGWKAWRERKANTFQMYSSITVGIERMVVTDITDSIAIVKFIQDYASNVKRASNAKKLIFIKNNGEWKISREYTFPKEELIL